MLHEFNFLGENPKYTKFETDPGPLRFITQQIWCSNNIKNCEKGLCPSNPAISLQKSPLQGSNPVPDPSC